MTGTSDKNNDKISNEDYIDIPLKGIRRVIARRLVESKAPIPHFYLTSEFGMDKIAALRSQLKKKNSEVNITYNDIIMKLTAVTLKEFPYINAHFFGDSIRKYRSVHIAFAVAVDDGIITPVIRNCDIKSIEEITQESKTLTERAKVKRLKRKEYEGATFTVTNLGMYPIENFSAIINPPECAILAIGSIKKTPVVENDTIKISHRMKVTLSCDHRVIDGAMGAEFLTKLKNNMENPLDII